MCPGLFLSCVSSGIPFTVRVQQTLGILGFSVHRGVLNLRLKRAVVYASALLAACV